jgi:hypothetical protein
MNDKWEKYLADNFDKNSGNKWDKYLAKTESEYSSEDELNNIRKQHPYLAKLAESLAGNKALKKAGDIAGHFNNAIEGTGLPSAAKGFLGAGIEAGRGLANLIPGIDIPKQQYPKLNVNPYLEQAAETAGSFGVGHPVYKGYQGAKSLLEAIPYSKNLPQALQSLLPSIGAGAGVGAALSSDNRGLGAVLGGTVSGIPSAIKAVQDFKPKAYEAIQRGFDTKLKNLSNMFEEVGKDVENSGIKKIKVPDQLYSEIEAQAPNSKAFRRFLEKSKSGRYEDLRKLNTELFNRGTKYASSPNPSDRELAEDMFNSRDILNDIISKALRHRGLEESANKLNKARGGYKSLMETYTAHPQIAKLVGKNRLVPKTSNPLKENSERLKQLKMHHPEIDRQLNYEKSLKNALQIGSGVAGLTGLGGIYKYLSKS